MPNRLEKTVAEFIRRHGMFAGAERILLAVSGGADSMALLHILAALRAQGEIGSELVCAHINHQLRGPASDADERFVLEQAGRLGLPAVTRAVDVRTCARTEGLSIETAGRQLRHAGLGEIAREHGCTWVCTGHQKNDNAETLLQRLERGTGFRGLAGIRPTRQLGDLRLASPLLCATRRELVRYLEDQALPWREDQTNADVVYTRNRIRHRLLPCLQQEAQSDLVEELSELAISAERLYDRVEREAEAAWSSLVESTAEGAVIRASGLTDLSEPVAVELIRRTAEGSELAQPHYRAVLELARKNVGRKEIDLPHGRVARRERGRITVTTARPPHLRNEAEPALSNSASAVLAAPGLTRFDGYEIEAAILAREEIVPDKLRDDKSPWVEYLDLDRVQPPLIVRPRQPGDKFQPLGLAHEKKVGKFLTAARTPGDVRARILIFADRADIVWVCPIRLSERVKITNQTHRVLQLTVRNM